MTDAWDMLSELQSNAIADSAQITAEVSAQADGKPQEAEQASQEDKALPENSSPAGQKDFHFLTADELEEWPDPEWWLYNMFPKYGLGQLYGDSGAGKSFIAIDLAHALSTGSNWFGWEFVPDEKGKHPHVFYLALEGASGVKRRVQALQKREADIRNREHYSIPDFHFSKTNFDITNEDDLGALTQQVVSLSGGVPPVVIVDTQQQSMPALDFSSSQHMSLVVKMASQLQKAINGFVLLVAHFPKTGDPKKGAFGSIVQKGVMEWQCYVEQIDGTEIRRFITTKIKDGVDGEARGFALCVRNLGVDIYGKPITSCTVERATIPQELKLTKKQLEMLESLEGAYMAEEKDFSELLPFEAWKKYVASEYDLDGEKLRTTLNNWRRTLIKAKVMAVIKDNIKLLKNTGSGQACKSCKP